MAIPEYSEHASAIIWFTGLSGAGKTMLCNAVARAFWNRKIIAVVLDADDIRRTMWPDLGFSREDREENVRRIATAAQRLAGRGVIVLVAAIAPYRAMRQELREKLDNLIEVYVNASLETCIERDTKGLYRRALANELTSFTGISDPYEPPLAPDIECNTDTESIEASTAKLLDALDALLTLQGTSLHAAK